jgi:hypothetical protein
MEKRKPKKLKSWMFVKEKKHNLTSLREGEDPSNFYYQSDGNIYYPAVHKVDFDSLP